MSGGSDRTARWLLAAGAAGGVLLTAVGILSSSEAGAPPPPGAIAVVDGTPISRETFARFAGAVAAERKETSLDAETRRRLLLRMIDEELLLERGIELGLHRLEPTARRSVVSALIASVTGEAELDEPDDDVLRAFYEENQERFARPGRVELDSALVRVGERPDPVAFREAEEIARRLRAGEPFAEVASALADAPVAPLPAGPLPVETLRKYLGPTPARTATLLQPGEVSDPTRGSAGYYVLSLRDRLPGDVAPFEEVREQVRAEYLRSVGETALRDYLAELRESADVRIYDPELVEP